MIKTIVIEGMTCAHCKARVEKALGAVKGVQSVTVDLDKKTATVKLSSDVSDKKLKAAVEEAGYMISDQTKTNVI